MPDGVLADGATGGAGGAASAAAASSAAGETAAWDGEGFEEDRALAEAIRLSMMDGDEGGVAVGSDDDLGGLAAVLDAKAVVSPSSPSSAPAPASTPAGSLAPTPLSAPVTVTASVSAPGGGCEEGGHLSAHLPLGMDEALGAEPSAGTPGATRIQARIAMFLQRLQPCPKSGCLCCSPLSRGSCPHAHRRHARCHQVQLANGKRCVRRFLLTDSVSALFAVVVEQVIYANDSPWSR